MSYSMISPEKVFIIAEIGVNHEGDMDKAREMVRLAAQSGADAVKFQTYIAEEYVSASQPERLARVKRFHLSFDQFRELKRCADREKVVFLSTPLDLKSLALVAELSPIVKISSGDINNVSLLTAAARTGKTVILSTGCSTIEEIEQAVGSLREGNPVITDDGKLILLHCLAAYPAPEDEVNILAISFLKERFVVPVGYSDHTTGLFAVQAAVAAGACVIEKHFTYRKEGQTFHDHQLSADPKEFAEMVASIRRIEKMMGSYSKAPQPSEEKFRSHIRRSLAASRQIKAGESLNEQNTCFLRPQTGIPITEKDHVLGRKVHTTIAPGMIILETDLGTEALS